MIKTIEVTQEDIDKGVIRKACECPIALAVKRTFNAKEVVVSPLFIGVIDQEGVYTDFITPSRAVDFIKKFDHDIEVAPFGFELAV